MKTHLLSFCLCLSFFLVLALCSSEDTTKSSTVTCGSSIKLKHVSSGFRLHSHKVTYGSGSGQQSVTGFPEFDDPNSLWTIHGEKDGSCPRGKALKHGDTVRLMHTSTRKNLHSHLHESPLTKQQEVSCYGDNGNGDSGDLWIVEVSDKGKWTRTSQVRFRHVDTGMYLYASTKAKFGSPIPGQLEVSAVKHTDTNTVWITEEGFFFEEEEEE